MPRDALEVVEVGEGVSAEGQGWGENGGQKGGGDGNGGGQTTSSNFGEGKIDGAKGGNAECNRCGEVGHKTVLCPERVCGICGGKGHSVEICFNNNVVVLLFLRAKLTRVRVSGVVKVLSNKEEVFVLDAPGKSCHEYNAGVSALAWQMGMVSR